MQIILNEGKNREIRRMLAQLKHKVMRLKRMAMGPIILGRLASGKSRPLRANEVDQLRQSRRPCRAAGVASDMTAFVQSVADVIENVPLARNTYRIRLHLPKLAGLIRPGQFVMLRIPGRTDPLLGRPFALYDTVLDEGGRPVAVDIVYLVVGKMTGLLATLGVGDRVEVWGPLGNGFPDLRGRKHVGLVAGGIGQTPFLAHVRDLLGGARLRRSSARRMAERVTLFYGVRTADLAAGVEDFRAAGAEVE